ncbi:hypothetical protein Tco_1352174 [Tanacetum coccineum]
MDDLGGVTHDEESDSYAGQDRCVAQLQSNHDEMAEFVEKVKKILPRLATLTPDVKATRCYMMRMEAPNAMEDPSNATIDVEHMDIVGNHEENEGPNANKNENVDGIIPSLESSEELKEVLPDVADEAEV